MSYALLWIEMLTVCLLWVAMLTALVGRKRRRPFAAWVTLICSVPLVCLLPLALVTGYLKFGMQFRTNWFYYAGSLLVAFLVGLVVILRLATRSGDPVPPRAAAAWPRGRLALAFLTASAVAGMTLWNMDLAARAAAEAGRTEAGAIMCSVAPPVVADDRNAALLYQRAFDKLTADPATTRLGASPDDNGFAPGAPQTAEFLDRQAAALRLLREGGALPECRFEHDYAHPSISTLLPELNVSRSSARLLRLDALHQLRRENVAAAIEDVNAMMQLGRHVGREPILVSLLVSLAIDKTAIDTLEEALPSVTDKQQLASLQVGDATEPQRSLRHAFMGEEAFGLSVFSDIADERLGFGTLTGDPSGGASSAADHDPQLMLLFRVFFLRDEMEDYRQCLHRYQQPRAAGTFPTDAGLAAENREEIEASRAGMLTRILLPALSRVRLQSAKSEAFRAGALAAVAMTRYRLDHGTYPAQLSLLVPEYLDELPADPFDGKPIRMAHANSPPNDRWTIYSIGPDGVDDGGKALDEKARTGDLVFTLKTPAPTATSKPSGP